MTKQKILELENVNADTEFKNVSIAGPINLSLYSQEILVMPGGKFSSLLIKLMLGQGTITQGNIHLYLPEESIVQTSERPEFQQLTKWCSQFGMVFRDYGLISNMTIFENVSLPLRYHGVTSVRTGEDFHLDTRVEEVLNELSIPDELWGKRPFSVPWNERKKALMARAIVRDPRVLIVDAPTHLLAYTDYPLCYQWIMRQRNEFQRAIIVNAENLPFGLAIADNIFHITNQTLYSRESDHLPFEGHIVEQGKIFKQAMDLKYAGVSL